MESTIRDLNPAELQEFDLTERELTDDELDLLVALSDKAFRFNRTHPGEDPLQVLFAVFVEFYRIKEAYDEYATEWVKNHAAPPMKPVEFMKHEERA